MALSAKEQEALSPSDILYKYLIKAELPRNTFLDELQEKYFIPILRKEFDENGVNVEETLEEIVDWELYGERLIENVSPEIETEEDLEVQLNQEVFIGSLDRYGNGSGKLNYFIFGGLVFGVMPDIIIIKIFKAFYKSLTQKMDCANFQLRDQF